MTTSVTNKSADGSLATGGAADRESVNAVAHRPQLAVNYQRLLSIGQTLFQARNCRLCPRHVASQRTVHPAGSPDAGLMVILDKPYAADERANAPAVEFRRGQADLAELLTTASIAPRRAWTAYLCMCRGGDNPVLPEQAMACRRWLRPQVTIIRPAVILAVGEVVAQSVLRSTESLVQLRGGSLRVAGAVVVATWSLEQVRDSVQRQIEFQADLDRVCRFLLAAGRLQDLDYDPTWPERLQQR